MANHQIQAESLTLGYDDHIIIDELNLEVPKGEITVLVGANGCGKSTLLKSMARLLKPSTGAVLLDGKDIAKTPSKEVAQNLALLPQSVMAPEGLTVYQLVKQGRYPHQSWMKKWSKEDEDIVENALTLTKMQDLRDRSIDELSGGQRQRAWIAMTLAQDTDVILLDEPTTYLDMTHQIDILDLLFDLNQQEGRTIIMVLHDLNLACRYAHNIVAIKNGDVYVNGKPEDVITCENVHTVFQMHCQVSQDPIFGTPLCIPHGKGRCLFKQQLEGNFNAVK
ncbi:ABC transporter ATP-binding protein [Alkalibacillus aidingensis]|uniref:ABC transporter ATP-binding protein n=1 Tax=Alkalibacillus aidingensis TaxID=2747607 RepID=UPI00166080C2|nr:ABC transporter ATP-binding protein [Alkalibacillus aidingensis]